MSEDEARRDGSAPGEGAEETVAFGADPLPPPAVRSSPAPPPPEPVDAPHPGGSASTPWRTRPPTPGAGPGRPSGPSGPSGPGPPGRVTGPSGGIGSSNALAVVAVGGVVVLVVVVVLMAVVLGFGDEEEGGPTTTDAGIEIAAGLLCRDLLADGASYDDAVIYWLEEGRPTRMDEDRNGIPCETVYPAADVEAVWGRQGLQADGVTPGLFCRDLVAEGLDYAAAVTYWETEGRPDRMDDDGNGRPCETVYPAEQVTAFWD